MAMLNRIFERKLMSMRLYVFGQGRKSTERTCVHGERARYGE